VILHELDVFVSELKSRCEKSSAGVKSQKTNPRYVALSDLISKCKANNARKEMIAAYKLRRNFKSLIPNPKYSHIEYVRYADDWLLGVWGPKSLAVSLKSEIASFLQSLKLTLSEEKTLITNLRKEKVKFLGTYIHRITPTRGPLAKPRAAGRLWMTAPLSILSQRLHDKGFWKKGGNGPVPKAITKFLAAPVKDLILRYRSILAGFLNYYSFARNIHSLVFLYYLLHGSLRSTICRKLDIGPREFKSIYGKNIAITIYQAKTKKWVDLDFAWPKVTTKPNNFQCKYEADPMRIKDWKVSTLTALNQNCANCASFTNVEMHHVRHLKTMNVKLSPFDKMMASINRKQVPLCRRCHNIVHKGNYGGFSLTHFNYLKWKGQAKWA
jgi:hypothetical protein